jgi:hypothetical protein
MKAAIIAWLDRNVDRLLDDPRSDPLTFVVGVGLYALFWLALAGLGLWAVRMAAARGKGGVPMICNAIYGAALGYLVSLVLRRRHFRAAWECLTGRKSQKEHERAGP